MFHSDTHPDHFARNAIRGMALSMGITLAFVLLEALAGIFSNSLALLTDAAHNLTDALALGLSWWALQLTTRASNRKKTYGYHRAGILAALVNSGTLVVIALGIFYEAYRRLVNPPEVQAGMLVGVGIVAVVINIVTAMLVRHGAEHDLNIRSAFLHLMGDVLSTLGAVIAGFIILFTGWNWLDPLVSVLIGLMILWSAWGILREAIDILMESAPVDLDVDNLVRDILSTEGVRNIHDLHVWSITRTMRTLSAHLVTDDMPVSKCTKLRESVNQLLFQKYGISHATMQFESECCHPGRLYCDLTEINKQAKLG